MCGIIGISTNYPNRDSFRGGIDVLSHRGPDASGLLEGKRLLLGHRRLSVLDLSPSANQPMEDAEGNTAIIFNGEIYNFKDLRGELETEGYRFRTRSDTEVILYSYKRWGVDCVSRFNGMFAFCIFDRGNDRLFLARDRAGKKPVYYYLHNDVFAFASEIKGLLSIIPDFKKEISPRALNYYFAMGFIPGRMTVFQQIRKLLPAHAMTFDLSRSEENVWRYWQIPEPDYVAHEESLIEELDGLLEDSVRMRMISDVPLGAFLSGGIDSSLVVAYMSRVSERPVKTFSIGFKETRFNELPFASIVANHFRTDHHEFLVSPEIVSFIPLLAGQYDDPFADPSMIPTYIVARETRRHVTVALTGDGGDELFGGYHQYLYGKVVDGFHNLLPPYGEKIRGAVFRRAEKLLPVGKSLLRSFGDDKSNIFLERHITGSMRAEAYAGDFRSELGSLLEEPERFIKSSIEEGEKKRGFVDSLMHFDFSCYLPDDVLTKVDRATMLVSLEARSPFLDYRVIEFAMGKIPASLKVKGITKKYLLKKLAKKVLPPQLDLERKMGFGIPLEDWFKGSDFRNAFYEVLPESGDRYLDRDALTGLLDEHVGGGKRHLGSFLFSVLMFQHWRKIFGV